MAFFRTAAFALLIFAINSLPQVRAANKVETSPFETALETLQKQIGYSFKNIGYLRRAMTHSSFSEENNRALSILGSNVIDTSVSMYYLGKDIEISPKALNRQISEHSKVEAACSVDGMRLALNKVVRVSSNTNSTTPTVVCGAFRALFGAVAIDTKKVDDAGLVFWRVHGSEIGRALAMKVERSAFCSSRLRAKLWYLST